MGQEREPPPARGRRVHPRRVTHVAHGDATIEYGVETYYADEDEARRLERAARRDLHVDLVLGRDGSARIAGVEVVR